MKKNLLLSTSIVLSFLFGCQKQQNLNTNASISSSKTSKINQKSILGPNPIQDPDQNVQLEFNGYPSPVGATGPTTSGVYNITAYNNIQSQNWNCIYQLTNTANGAVIPIAGKSSFENDGEPGLQFTETLAPGSYSCSMNYLTGTFSGTTRIATFTIYSQPQFTGTTSVFPTQYQTTNFEATISPILNGTAIYRSASPLLAIGQAIYSPNGKVELILQTDGNLVDYLINADGTKTSIWSSNTAGSSPKYLYFQPDGNLVLRNPSGALWSSQLYSTDAAFPNETSNQPFYYLQNDGNLVLYWPEHYAIGGGAGTNACYVIVAAADGTITTPSTHFGDLNHYINVSDLPSGNFSIAGGSYSTN